jgi:hypothetical protein
MREKYKDIDLDNRRWRITRLPALAGNTLALKVLSRLGGLVTGAIGGAFPTKEMLAMVLMQELGSFSTSEFMEIQVTALSVCSELKSISEGHSEAPHPIRLSDGRWSDKELEEDGPLVLALTCHALVFNLAPFFDVNALKLIGESFKTAYPDLLMTITPNASTSITEPTPQ